VLVIRSCVCVVCVGGGGGGSSQGLSVGDQKLSRHGSSSSLTNSVCSVQSGCTEKAIDNLSMKDSIVDGRYVR